MKRTGLWLLGIVYLSGFFCFPVSAHLQILGNYTQIAADGVDVVGSAVYVAARTKGLVILEVDRSAFPVFPVLIGEYTEPGWNAANVVVSGTMAYVSGSGLRILDVSDRTTPVLLGSIDAAPGSTVKDMAVVDGMVYLVHRGGGGLRIVDARDPFQPWLAGVYTDLRMEGVAAVGTIVYASDFSQGSLHIVDCSDPASPQPIKILAGIGGAGVAAGGRFVFVAGLFEYNVVDVADPTQATVVHKVIMPQDPVSFLKGVAFRGGKLYLTGYAAGFAQA